MLRLLRKLFGLCDHNYTIVKVEDIPWRLNDNGSIIVIDMAHRGVIRVRRHWTHCSSCGKIKVYDFKMGLKG